MRVIYFTTSLCEDDFKDFTNIWKIALNTSNQNFHNKIIRSIGSKCHVDVVSIRPFSRTKCMVFSLDRGKTINDDITYHYLPVSGIRIFRNHKFKKEAYKLVKRIKDEDTVLVTDTINPKAITIANYIKKKFKLPLVGICTDSPSNISGTRKSYTVNLLKQSKDLEGYISLTRELNTLFNPFNKDSIIIEGVVEEKMPERIKNKYGDYFFFGGALMKRYGIYDLIEAFKNYGKTDLNLVICGHHADEEGLKKAIGKNKNIIYLKNIPVKEALQLEMNAVANINPRPFSEDLDRFSIPSKTLEYFSSGTPTISVKNTKLMKKFQDEAIWCKSSSEKELTTAFDRLFALSGNERKMLGRKAQEKVIELYSISVVGEQITDYLSKFVK